jgi:hypothetical protein
MFKGMKNNLVGDGADNVGLVGTLGEGFRGIGVGVTETVADLGKRLVNTVTGLPAHIGEQISNIGETVKGINIAPGFSVEDMLEQWQEPSWDDLTDTLGKITGVNINSIQAQFSSNQAVKSRIAAYMAVIKRQVSSEVRDCIENYLRALIGKVPILGKLLDIQGAVNYEIGKLQRRLRFGIEDRLERLWYQKLKMHQIGDFKMKILEAIRKICPSHHSPPPVTRIPPSLTKRLQTDTTWKLPDGDRSVIELAREKGSSSDVYHAERGNSTGSLVEAVVEEAVAGIEAEASIQAIGYNTSKVSDYVNADGTLA